MNRENSELTPLHSATKVAQSVDSALFDRVAALIDQTRSATATQANLNLTLMNWHIGRMIDAEVLQEARAGYDQNIVATLERQLSWTHFKALIAVPNPEARDFYAKQVTTARLSVRALRDFEDAIIRDLPPSPRANRSQTSCCGSGPELFMSDHREILMPHGHRPSSTMTRRPVWR